MLFMATSDSRDGQVHAQQSPSLSASLSQANVYLELSNHSGSWWFRIGGGSCAKSDAATVGPIRGYGQPSEWTMTIRAYSDSACASEIGFTTLDMPATRLLTEAIGKEFHVQVLNFNYFWWFRIKNGSCAGAGPGFYSGVLDYEPGVYGIKAYKSSNGCLHDYSHSILGEGTITITNSSIRLDAAGGDGDVYLRIVVHSGDWWYKIGDGDCMATDSRTHGPIRGYGQPSEWTMTIRAYSDSACANEIASTTLDMPATGLSASVRTGEVEFTLSNYSLDWWLRIDDGSCTRVSGNTTSIVPDQAGQFTARAYKADLDCASVVAYLGGTTYNVTNVTIDDMALVLSASASDSVVGITLSKHDGSAYPNGWWFRIDDGGCTGVSGSTVSSIRGYHRTYDWTMNIRAYSDSGCSVQVAYTTLDMPAISLSASVSDGAVSLQLSHYPTDWINWWFRIDNGSCARAFDSTVSGISGYGQPNDWTMTIRAYSDGGCGSQIAQTTLDMPATGLSASVSDGLVRLTVSNYAMNWWYKIGDGACAGVSGGTTGDISGYQAGTHSAKAYKSGNGCNNDIAYTKLGETTFTIETPAPPPPTPSLSASVSGGAVSLTLSNHSAGWWFRIENGSCAQASGSTVSGISGYGQPNDWTMTIRAYSDGGCANPLDSATLDMPATSLSASVSDDRKVDLTLSNYALNWWFRIGGGSCTEVAGATVSGISGYQPGAYAVNAYKSHGGCYYNYHRLGQTTFTIP